MRHIRIEDDQGTSFIFDDDEVECVETMPYGNEQLVIVTTRKGSSRLDVRLSRLVFRTRERAMRVMLGLARGESVSPDEDAR